MPVYLPLVMRPWHAQFWCLNLEFGEVVQHCSPPNKHYWHFLIPPSGPTSGAKRCWKMESWGPGMHSFDASTLNFGEVVQHISPLNNYYWHFLIPPSRVASGSRRCLEIEAWGPGFHSFEAFNMNFRYFGQYNNPWKRHCCYFLISPSGPPSGWRGCWKM